MNVYKKQSTKLKEYDSRYALTFGEVAILHVGGKELGNGIRDTGFSVDELKELSDKIGNLAEYVSISNALPEHLRKDKIE